MQLGKPDLALPNLVELHTRTMTDPAYARQIAETYRQLEQPKQALAYYRELTQINPYEASAYQAITELCIQMNLYKDAAAAAENLTLLQPGSSRSWANLAVTKYHLGREAHDKKVLQAARADVAKALEIDAADSHAKRILQRIEKALGDTP